MSELREKMIAAVEAANASVDPCENVADAIIADLPSMIKPLVWEHTPGINDKWVASHGQGCIFELDTGKYRCGLVATYENLEDAKAHYQRRFAAKMMLEAFGERIEP